MGSLRRRRLVRHTSVLLLATLGAACHDAPTLPAPVQRSAPAAVQLDQGRHLGEVPFYCAQGRAAPSGWQTRRLTVFIPRGELDGAGRVVRYEYSRAFSDGTPFASATCVVPYTEGALRRLDRAFDVRENGGADQFRARAGMITTQGCVTDDAGCTLDPMFVKPPPVQPVTDPDDVCTRYPGECDDGSGGDGWDGGEWGGGGSGDGALEGDTDGDGDTLDEGPGAFAACVAVGIGVDGWASILGSAYAAYKLFQARADVRDAYADWAAYNTSHAGNDEWSPHIDALNYRIYLNAQDAEEALWASLALASGVAAWKIGAAVKTCAPLLAAPTA